MRRVTSNSKKGRQLNSRKAPRSRSKYAPHIGVKEQERAKRCRMEATHGEWSSNLRSAPTLCQYAR